MPKLRRTLFQLLTALLLTLIVLNAWGLAPGKRRSSITLNATSDAGATDFDEHLLEVQARILVGAKAYAVAHTDEVKPGKTTDPAQQTINSLAERFFREVVLTPKPLPDRSATYPPLLQRKLILASYLGLTDSVEKLGTALEESLKTRETERPVSELVLRSVGNAVGEKVGGVEPTPPTPPEQVRLREELGWFAELLLYSVAEGSNGNEQELAAARKRIEEPAIYSFQKFAVAMMGASGAMLIGFCSFVVIAWKWHRGKLRSQLQLEGIPRDFCLEIFCIYLLGLYALPSALEAASDAGFKMNILVANVVGISSLLIVLGWPTLFGQKFADVRRTIGFRTIGFGRFIKDIILAPFVYLAAWVPLLLILFVYAFVISLFGIDTSTGAHPIVPILLKSDDQQTFLYVALLAVVIAPFIEELMFRGAFYGWLRERMRPLPAAVVSSLIFAAVHPQGAIGVVPLGFIGFVLALIREWRGNLTASILVHGCFNGGTMVLLFLLLK